MRPTLDQVIEFANSDLETAKPPSPYDIAITMAAALLSSGRFGDDPSAAMETAWILVTPFYQGRLAYERNTQMLFDLSRHASQAEEPMTGLEARAYVSGGETGDFGEGGGAQPLASMTFKTTPSIGDQALQARQAHIAECTLKVQAAAAVLEAARISGGKAKIARAQKAFDAAAAEQSAAYL
jgi:hypothetical protein